MTDLEARNFRLAGWIAATQMSGDHSVTGLHCRSRAVNGYRVPDAWARGGASEGIRRSSLSRSSCGLQMRPIEIQGGSEPFLVLCGEFGQQLHLGNSRAIERFDVRPVDLDQISRWVPQIHLDAAIRKFVDWIAKRPRVERANRLRGVVGSMEIVHIYRKVLVERNLIFQLEDVQLQIAAAEILCFEPKIVAGDALHAQYGLVEVHRLREILGTYRHVVEAGNLHHSPPMKAKRRRTGTRPVEVMFRIVYRSLVIQDRTHHFATGIQLAGAFPRLSGRMLGSDVR